MSRINPFPRSARSPNFRGRLSYKLDTRLQRRTKNRQGFSPPQKKQKQKTKTKKGLVLFESYVVGMSSLCRGVSQSELGGELAASREPGDAEFAYGSLGWLCRVLQFLRCCLVIGSSVPPIFTHTHLHFFFFLSKFSVFLVLSS